MNSASADLMVLSSRGQDCRKGSTVSVALQDLQEMQNQMQATIDRGMGDLQSKQGQGGLPTLPQGSAGTIDSPYAQAAQPDTNVASELTTVTQEADRAEQQAVSQSGEWFGGPADSLARPEHRRREVHPGRAAEDRRSRCEEDLCVQGPEDHLHRRKSHRHSIRVTGGPKRVRVPLLLPQRFRI